MIDIHNHCIFGIDDGAKSIEDSIDILKKAAIAGFDTIVATPHYTDGNTYCADNEKKSELLDLIRCEALKQNINIKLYLGNEVFITENIIELIDSKKVSTINNSKYVLMELPRNDEIKNLDRYIFKIISSGYIPIFAHPERYEFVKQDPNALIQYIEQGALFQSNFGSILGQYGMESKRVIKILLRHKMVHFLASDTHHSRTEAYDKILDIKKILSKMIDKEYIENLTTKNPTLIIENKDIKIDEPIKYKKSFFSRLKI